jgi:FtsP/CotA-like multicopper oxidase with cupredoxin domain
MARTALASQTADADGLTVAFTAANVDGHTIGGGGDVILLVDNASGGTVDVTVQTPATQDGLAIADQVITCADAAVTAIAGLASRTYDRPSGATDAGKVYVDFASVTSVTVAALEVG